MIRLSIILAASMTLASITSHAQKIDMAAERGCNPADRPQRYGYMAKAVSQANSNVTEDTLKGDLAVIKKAQTSLDERYRKQGFGPCDVDRVTELTWVELREKNAHQRFTESQFIQKAGEDWGGLRIKSVPPGAQIWVDDKPWAKPTDAEDMTHDGKRIVRLHLEGYEDSTGEKVVIPGQWVEYKKTLKKK